MHEEGDEKEHRKNAPFKDKWVTGVPLGRGAYGVVHKVITDKGITCATKTIRMPFDAGMQANHGVEIKLFVQGEENLCKLKHENIVNFLWIEQIELDLVLFMEFIDGDTLKNRINGSPLDEDTIACFSAQICSALSYMHSQSPPVIHRDINCNNIMVLNGCDRIKLIDFGLSIRLQNSFTHYSASSVTPRGTLHFMAPELFGGDDSEDSESIRYSRKSDIWAFGCTVYQMSTGFLPHENCKIVLSLALKLKHKGAPDLSSTCSKELTDFYSNCVHREPKDRKSAEDLLRHTFLATVRRSVACNQGLQQLKTQQRQRPLHPQQPEQLQNRFRSSRIDQSWLDALFLFACGAIFAITHILAYGFQRKYVEYLAVYFIFCCLLAKVIYFRSLVNIHLPHLDQ